MKRLKRSVVILLCIATLLAIFGCKAKDKYILDGPGMVNHCAWDTFYVSRSGDSYAQHNFDITVTYSEKKGFNIVIRHSAVKPEPVEA